MHALVVKSLVDHDELGKALEYLQMLLKKNYDRDIVTYMPVMKDFAQRGDTEKVSSHCHLLALALRSPTLLALSSLSALLSLLNWCEVWASFY